MWNNSAEEECSKMIPSAMAKTASPPLTSSIILPAGKSLQQKGENLGDVYQNDGVNLLVKHDSFSVLLDHSNLSCLGPPMLVNDCNVRN